MMRSSLELFLSSFASLPSASSWFNLYASFSAFFMLLRTAINDLIPSEVQSLIVSKLRDFFFDAQHNDSFVTLEITKSWDDAPCKLFSAAKEYLPTKITHTFKSLKVGVPENDNTLSFAVNGKQEVVDEFEGMKLHWKFIENSQQDSHPWEKNTLILSFDAKHRDRVMNTYLPHILSTYEAMKAKQRTVKLHYMSYGQWANRELKHPATFKTLAFDPELKQRIIEDIDRFLRRKELYKKVGKPWKRGYLLYGPPGTGKSSLIAAMANYLRFDVYNLELARVSSDSDLMRAMRDTSNRSIVVIEDIDCNKQVHARSPAPEYCASDSDSDSVSDLEEHTQRKRKRKFTLSGLLNYMDGLWSSSGEERIIVFTTNHIEKIDAALVRAGRMDMHIHLSFCRGKAFRILASNYLGIQGDHPLFEQIDGLLDKIQVTPATMAEQLLRFEDPNVALEQIVKFLEDKDMEISEAEKPIIEY